MKKLCSLMLCALLALATSAQGIYQFADPGFEGAWASSEEPGNGWTSFSSADAGSLGGFIGGIAKGQSPKPSKVAGYNSATAVKIFSKNIMGANANGNLTTGQIHMGSSTPTDASNYNVTKPSDSNHSLLFAGMPDAVSFYAKFKSGGSPNGRGQFILHDNCEYRDPELSSQSGNRVGKASVLITPCNDWTFFEGQFTYDRSSKPDTQYLLATFTTNPTPGGSANDELIVDEVHFTYYNTLASLAFEGASINFKEDTRLYDLTDFTYNSNQLSYKAKGAGATVEKSYDANSGILTITVKAGDYEVNRSNTTTYLVQFDNSGEPIVDPDPNPNPNPEPGEDGVVNDLSQLTYEKTYLLYNEHFTTHAIYAPQYSGTNVWSAGMIGDSNHQLSSSNYSDELDDSSANSSWMILKNDEGYYLYNVGAKMFLITPNESNGTEGVSFTSTPTPIQITDLGNSQFAFNTDGGEYNFMCVSPQLEVPINTWSSDDAGSAWKIIENPNVEFEREIVETLIGPIAPEAEPLGEPITSLEELSRETTYVLYNPCFTAYAIASGYSTNFLWAAEMTGGDEEHRLSDPRYAEALVPTDPNTSWMIIESEGLYYVYNMGSARYLSTPGYNDKTYPCMLVDEKTGMQILDLEDGTFAFTTTGDEKDYMCAAPQASLSPISIWTYDDPGSAWQIIPNPNVEADPSIAELINPIGVSLTKQTNEADNAIYSITGVKMGTSLKNAPRGLYIQNGKKIWVK